jgi:phenylpyruvate tautomerase PptA (4-oxalocrotonate tautomerase family)
LAQVKIFGLKQTINEYRSAMSKLIHLALVSVLELPPEKMFQRFFPLEEDDFKYPNDRSSKYTIIEISLFEGRSEQKIKDALKTIMKEMEAQLGFSPNDVEITVFQSPKYCWGIRGKTGDELQLGYKVNI